MPPHASVPASPGQAALSLAAVPRGPHASAAATSAAGAGFAAALDSAITAPAVPPGSAAPQATPATLLAAPSAQREAMAVAPGIAQAAPQAHPPPQAAAPASRTPARLPMPATAADPPSSAGPALMPQPPVPQVTMAVASATKQASSPAADDPDAAIAPAGDGGGGRHPHATLAAAENVAGSGPSPGGEPLKAAASHEAVPPDAALMAAALPAAKPASPAPGLPAAAAAATGITALPAAATPLSAPAAGGGAAATSQSAALTPGEQLSPVLLRLGSSAGSHHISLQLTPDHLGRVDISVEQPKAGPVTVRLTAETPQALAVLEHDKASLSATLDRAGLPSADRVISFHLAPAAAAPASVIPPNAGGDGGSQATLAQQGSGFQRDGTGQRPRQSDAAAAGDGGIDWSQPIATIQAGASRSLLNITA